MKYFCRGNSLPSILQQPLAVP
uniref:Uncharacterized protein n=1 Tax=Arundo donax TaxID=35708 RepID=A0A0A9BS08_ARUDO